MALENFKNKIWTAQIMRTLEDKMVARQISYTNFEGEVKKSGDTVYFNGLADPTIAAYNGSITYETLQDASISLLIDQKNKYSFKVDDVDKAQSMVNAKDSQATRAAYGLKKAADTYVLGLHTGAGTTITAVTVTAANVLSTVSEFVRQLEDNNVYEKEQRWMVVPPWFKQKLYLAGVKFGIKNGINGSDGMAWTDELDINLFVSNQVPNSGTAALPVSTIMGGSNMAIGYADQLIENEALRLQDQFADAVRGLHIFGAKVIKPKELVKCVCTYAVESTI